jgi:hypothetical protein
VNDFAVDDTFGLGWVLSVRSRNLRIRPLCFHQAAYRFGPTPIRRQILESSKRSNVAPRGIRGRARRGRPDSEGCERSHCRPNQRVEPGKTQTGRNFGFGPRLSKRNKSHWYEGEAQSRHRNSQAGRPSSYVKQISQAGVLPVGVHSPTF